MKKTAALRAIKRDDAENRHLRRVGERGGLKSLRALFLAGERSEPSIITAYQDLIGKYGAPGALVSKYHFRKSFLLPVFFFFFKSSHLSTDSLRIQSFRHSKKTFIDSARNGCLLTSGVPQSIIGGRLSLGRLFRASAWRRMQVGTGGILGGMTDCHRSSPVVPGRLCLASTLGALTTMGSKLSRARWGTLCWACPWLRLGS